MYNTLMLMYSVTEPFLATYMYTLQTDTHKQSTVILCIHVCTCSSASNYKSRVPYDRGMHFQF